MDKYIYDESNGLWYELQGEYYIPCLELPAEKDERHIGVWGQRYLRYKTKTGRFCVHTRKRPQNHFSCVSDFLSWESIFFSLWISFSYSQTRLS